MDTGTKHHFLDSIYGFEKVVLGRFSDIEAFASAAAARVRKKIAFLSVRVLKQLSGTT